MWRSCRRRDLDSKVRLTGERMKLCLGETVADGNNTDGGVMKRTGCWTDGRKKKKNLKEKERREKRLCSLLYKYIVFGLFSLDEPLDEVVMICMMYSYKYKKSPLFLTSSPFSLSSLFLVCIH